MTKRILVVPIALLISSPAFAAVTREVVLSFQDLDCGDCGAKAVDAVKKQKGIAGAEFDLGKAELHVKVTDAAITETQLMDWVRTDDVKPVVGAGRGSYLPFAEMPAGADVKTISAAGEDVKKLAEHAVPGKYTVFDFYAPWCEPCRELDGHMAELLETRTDIAYRKLNVVDWNSPLTKRYLKKVPALPYMIVYGKDGKTELGKVLGLKPEVLDTLVTQGAK